MQYLGFYGYGDYLPLYVQTVNANDVPTAPDAVPTAKIIDKDGTVGLTLSLPIRDRINYGFGLRDILNLDYDWLLPTRNHSILVMYSWVISGTTMHKMASFRLCSADTNYPYAGAILSLARVQRPGGEWIVMHDGDKNVKAGFRPYV